jgi:Uma2 family endonuclease
MATLPLASKLTYQDYCLLPEDGKRHEILDGEHYVSPAPNVPHQRILGNLFAALHAYLTGDPRGEAFLAPLDVILSDFDVVQPDLVYVSAARAAIVTETHLQGAPDLVVEVLSEGSRQRDLVVKKKRYEHFGVEEYWVVDPVIEGVTVLRRQGELLVRAHELSREGGEQLATPLLPGFALPLDRLFC